MFPKEKNEAVMRALRTTFGAAGIEDLRLLSGGGRADLIFRIVVQGSPFLLRIIRRTDDPVCHFTCMQAAADAGLAPQVLYTSVEDRICITGFVNAVPLSPQDALVRLPAALRTLHALPPFPARAAHLNTTCTFLLNEGPARDKFIQGLSGIRCPSFYREREIPRPLRGHSRCIQWPHRRHGVQPQRPAQAR